MKTKEILNSKFNKHILKHFHYLDKYLKTIHERLHVILSLQAIRLLADSENKPVRIHVHNKIDLDQRLSLYYMKKFFKETPIEIIRSETFEVLKTQPFDIIIDTKVSESFNHKNVLVFDHHKGESKNTLEQIQKCIFPSIPDNLVAFVDNPIDFQSTPFKPQHINFLKDYTCEKIIEIFKNGKEYDNIDKHEYPLLYKRWKSRKRSSKKTLIELEKNLYESIYGDVVILKEALYNSTPLSIKILKVDYLIKIKEVGKNRSIMVIMTLPKRKIHDDILLMIKSYNDNVTIYSDKSMAMVGSLSD